MATASRLPVQNQPAAPSPRPSSPNSSLVPLALGFSFPLVGTLLDIIGQGLPLSVGSALTVQQAHPLLWLLDLVPALMLLLPRGKNRPVVVTSVGSQQQGVRGATTSPATEGSAQPQKAIMRVQAELSAVKIQLEKVRTSESSLLALIENAGDAIITLSEAGTVTLVNRGAENMLGWTRQEMVGHPISNFLTLASLPQMEAHLTQSLTNPTTPSIIEIEFVHSDGHGLWAEGSTSVVRDASGKATGVVVISRDLSPRRQLVEDHVAPVPPQDHTDLQPGGEPEETVSPPLSFHVTHSGALKVHGLFGDFAPTAEAFAERDALSSPTAPLVEEPDSPLETTPSAPIQFTFADRLETETRSPSSAITHLPFADTKRAENPRTVSIPFDFSHALSNIGGDEELLAELAGIFLEEYPEVIENIRAAVANNDSEALMYHAHALKGSVGNFVARDVERSVRLLEQFAREGNLADAPTVLGELEAALARLTPALSDLAAQQAAEQR
jgi:PAS domain S-box-containing protein